MSMQQMAPIGCSLKAIKPFLRIDGIGFIRITGK